MNESQILSFGFFALLERDCGYTLLSPSYWVRLDVSCWLRFDCTVQMGVESWQTSFTCWTIKQIIFSWLAHTTHSIRVLMKMCMLPFKVCMFPEQNDQTQIKAHSPSDPVSPNASVTVSSKICSQNNFKAASWDGPAYRLLSDKPCTHPSHQ